MKWMLRAAMLTTSLVTFSATAAEPIRIGFAIAQSGFMSAYDSAPFKAAVLKIEELNAAGGVLGRPVEYLVSDTKTDRGQAAKSGAELVSKKIDLMVISADYDFGAPAGLAAQKAGIPAISLGAADPKMGVQGVGKLVFTASGAAQVEGINMAEFAYRKKGIKRPYVLEDQTIEYSKSGCAGFRAAWKQMSPGSPIAGSDVFKNDDPSIAAQITRIKNTNPAADAIYLCSFTPGGASAIRQIRAAGITLPILANVGMTDDYWLGAVPDLSNFYVTTFMSIFGDDPRPALNGFLAKFTKKYGARPESAYSVLGYSLIEQWAIAVERARSTEGNKVVAELEKFKDEPLTIGPTSYSKEMHIQTQRPLLIMNVENGKHRSVEVWRNEMLPSTQLLFRMAE